MTVSALAIFSFYNRFFDSALLAIFSLCVGICYYCLWLLLWLFLPHLIGSLELEKFFRIKHNHSLLIAKIDLLLIYKIYINFFVMHGWENMLKSSSGNTSIHLRHSQWTREKRFIKVSFSIFSGSRLLEYRPVTGYCYPKKSIKYD